MVGDKLLWTGLTMIVALDKLFAFPELAIAGAIIMLIGLLALWKEQHQGSEQQRQAVLAKVRAEKATGTLERWLEHNLRRQLKPSPPHEEVLQITQCR